MSLLGLLQQVALFAACLVLAVEVALDRPIGVDNLAVGVDVVVEEGVRRQHLVGHLQVLELLEEGFPALVVPEVVDHACRASVHLFGLCGRQGRLRLAEQRHEAPLERLQVDDALVEVAAVEGQGALQVLEDADVVDNQAALSCRDRGG